MKRLDPELVEPLQGLLEATGGGFSLRDIPATRALVDGMVAAVKADLWPVPGVETEDVVAPSADTDVSVPARIYRPAGTDDPLPALIWMHAGGFVIGGIEMDDLLAAAIAQDVGCAVVSVGYRLAPEHPYPAALDDCYGVLCWLSAEAVRLGLDPTRIAVGGASAGGALAAALALRSRYEGGPPICLQLLVYPALDDRNTAQVGDGAEENLFWSRENALIGWRAYLSDGQGGADVDPLAAPIRATDLAGLPPAFIAVGTADMFLDENVAYAERLSAAGGRVELRIYPGAFHAFDAFAPMARVSQQFVTERNEALRAAFTR